MSMNLACLGTNSKNSITVEIWLLHSKPSMNSQQPLPHPHYCRKSDLWSVPSGVHTSDVLCSTILQYNKTEQTHHCAQGLYRKMIFQCN